ncbi:RNA polymerase sigma factor [Amycolatopsis thailandensis]|nr:sigma-70 family RNA polymerase sigma factor [Amycolatopsis thailandensis]
MAAPSPRPDEFPGSFEAFYLATFAKTFNASRRMAAGDTHLAHDATQEAYLVMLRRWSDRQHRSQDDNRKYVAGVAANKVIDAYRHRHRHVQFDDELDVPADGDQYAEVLDDLTLLAAVRTLIATQPPRRRAVATLYFLAGLDSAEIAESLTMSESTVRTHIQRLRSILKPRVDQISRTDQGGETS